MARSGPGVALARQIEETVSTGGVELHRLYARLPPLRYFTAKGAMKQNGDTLRIGVALLLAAAAALITSNRDVREKVILYLAAALAPSAVDLGTIATNDPDVLPP